jgi:hypothetical protein
MAMAKVEKSLSTADIKFASWEMPREYKNLIMGGSRRSREHALSESVKTPDVILCEDGLKGVLSEHFEKLKRDDH